MIRNPFVIGAPTPTPVRFVLGNYFLTQVVQEFASAYPHYIHAQSWKQVKHIIRDRANLPSVRGDFELCLVIVDLDSLGQGKQPIGNAPISSKYLRSGKPYNVHFLLLSVKGFYVDPSIREQIDQVFFFKFDVQRNTFDLASRFYNVNREHHCHLFTIYYSLLKPNECVVIDSQSQDTSIWQSSQLLTQWTIATHLRQPPRVRQRVTMLLHGQIDANSLLSTLDKDLMVKILEYGAALDSYSIDLSENASSSSIALFTTELKKSILIAHGIPDTIIHTANFENLAKEIITRQELLLKQDPGQFKLFNVIVDQGVLIDRDFATNPLINFYDYTLSRLSRSHSS